VASQIQCHSCCHAYTTKPAHFFFLIDTKIRAEIRIPEDAVPGRFTLMPTPGMLAPLRRDYERMAGMIFGPVPDFDTVIRSIESFEAAANSTIFPGVE
jgi:hypothetical protein